MSGDIVVLVGCGAAKRGGRTEYEARNLYTSTYFKKKRAFAERLCDRWYILSALHGLLDPHETVTSYDKSVKDFDVHERYRWAHDVADDLDDVLKGQDVAIVLAGRAYVEPIADVIEEALLDRLRDPFSETSGIGEQISWMDRAIATGDPFAAVDPSEHYGDGSGEASSRIIAGGTAQVKGPQTALQEWSR